MFKDITGNQIKRYQGNNNLMIGDSSSLKKQKLGYEDEIFELSCSDITKIMNECPLY